MQQIKLREDFDSIELLTMENGTYKSYKNSLNGDDLLIEIIQSYFGIKNVEEICREVNTI